MFHHVRSQFARLIAAHCFCLACVVPCPAVAFQEAKEAARSGNGTAKPMILQSHHRRMEELDYRRGKSKSIRIRGIILSEDKLGLDFAEIVFPPDQPSYAKIHRAPVNSVVSLRRLPTAEHEQLKQNLEPILNFRSRARIESGLIANLVVDQRVTDNLRVIQTYRGDWFSLESSVDKEITSRCILRIEQVFRAFQNAFANSADSTNINSRLRIQLFGSMNEYRKALRRHGYDFDNPACYIPDHEVILAGSELNSYYSRLKETRKSISAARDHYNLLNRGFNDRLAEHVKKLKQHGANSTEIRRETQALRRVWRSEFDRKLKDLDDLEKENDATFDDVTDRMFATLFHEAFHAYLQNHLFPNDEFRVPAWLNEGLAQVFEGCQVDGDTLRVDAPNPSRLDKLQNLLASSSPPRLAKLMRASNEVFVHSTDRVTEPGRMYLVAWGLAHYLFCDANILSRDTLVRYLSNQADDDDALARFELLVGTDVDSFQQQWQEAMLDKAIN